MIKGGMLNLMKASGTFDLTRLAHRRRALILTYHRFSEGEEEGKTSAQAFAEQLEYLMSHYKVVPLDHLVKCLNHPRPHSKNAKGLAAITIDDGYRDCYEIAYPLLRRHSAPASIFVVTEFANHHLWIWTDKARYLCMRAREQSMAMAINGHTLQLELGDQESRCRTALRINNLLKTFPNEVKEEALEQLAETFGVSVPRTPPDELRSISWDQARDMVGNGIEIGSHTMTHPILTAIDNEQLHRELHQSRMRLEEVLGRRVEQFCYPNGDHDDRVKCEVARAGYRAAVTTMSGLNKPGDDPLTLRRVHTERDLVHFIQSTSGFEELKNRVRNFRIRSALARPVSFSAQQ